jgi:ribosomal protein L11 methyltransferase
MKTPRCWLEITLTVSPEVLEACSSLIFEETGQGSHHLEPREGEEGPFSLKAYLLKEDGFREKLIRLKRRVAALKEFFPEARPALWDLCLVPEENWQENWKRFFKPIRVCSNLTVIPAWESVQPREGEHVIRLDPGQAFGTGGHVSTRLCLKGLDRLVEEAKAGGRIFDRVLDIGTGTGILALAAAILGAESVLAIDNDPLAVESARAHVLLNGLDRIIQVEEASPETLTGSFSLILANLTGPDLIRLAAVLKRLLSPKGFLIVSGFLDSQARSVIKAMAREKNPFYCLYLEEEWACALFGFLA